MVQPDGKVIRGGAREKLRGQLSSSSFRIDSVVMEMFVSTSI
jgi:hypothetical protein